jgi:trehalose-6-phosphatase
MGQPEFISVQKALAGVDYPATKDELVKHAEERGADQDTLEALKRLPAKQDGGPNEVSAAVART